MEIVSFQSGRVSPGIKYYNVDTEADKNNLPVGKMGNRCYVIESKKWYILDSNGEWVPFASEGGSVDADAILSIIDGMSDSEKAQLISELGMTSVFTFKGVVAAESDLPLSGNSAGDVYLVTEESSEYVWIITNSIGSLEIGRWEMLGSNSVEVTPASIVTATEQMNDAQKSQTRTNLGVVSVSNASLGHGYATCSTAVATAAKTASLSSYSLTVGGYVAVKFTNAVLASATLNINNKGAKPIYYHGDTIGNGVIQAGDLAVFLYNGSQYHLVSIDRWGVELTQVTANIADIQISKPSRGEMEDAIMADIARILVPMTVDGGNLVLDLERWGGIEGLVNAYSNGLNAVFALPMLYLDQTASSTDILMMQLMGIDQENGVFHFEGVRGGKYYYARMTPISSNVLSGLLNIKDLASKADFSDLETRIEALENLTNLDGVSF